MATRTMDELTVEVSKRAKSYLEETDEKIDNFPQSIVDFVIEYAIENCHFPSGYDDDKIATILWKYKSSLAMACNEVYAKAGAEGQTEHRESDVSRSYKSSWISSDLVNALPNYVGFF